MGSKTISISDEAYEHLRLHKDQGESFTQVILRLTRTRPLIDFAGILSPDDADALHAAVADVRAHGAGFDRSVGSNWNAQARRSEFSFNPPGMTET